MSLIDSLYNHDNWKTIRIFLHMMKCYIKHMKYKLPNCMHYTCTIFRPRVKRVISSALHVPDRYGNGSTQNV